jgi:hypothetical protein
MAANRAYHRDRQAKRLAFAETLEEAILFGHATSKTLSEVAGFPESEWSTSSRPTRRRIGGGSSES